MNKTTVFSIEFAVVAILCLLLSFVVLKQYNENNKLKEQLEATEKMYEEYVQEDNPWMRAGMSLSDGDEVLSSTDIRQAVRDVLQRDGSWYPEIDEALAYFATSHYDDAFMLTRDAYPLFDHHDVCLAIYHEDGGFAYANVECSLCEHIIQMYKHFKNVKPSVHEYAEYIFEQTGIDFTEIVNCDSL